MTAPTIDRIAPTRKPTGSRIGSQSWRSLSFLHWRIAPEAVQRTLPGGMTVDTFEGEAWIALVPFSMRNVRPWWSPSVPGLSHFLETNVRTYVVVDGEPGVYFYSLDAANSIAVRIARGIWSLPYFRSTMTLERNADRVRYTASRRWPDPAGVRSEGEVRINAAAAPFHAEAGTLEHFLAERYLLFTIDGRSRMLRGQVYHTPYPLRSAEVLHLDDELVSSAGFPLERAPDHVLFSDGVDVDIHPLKPIV